MDIYKLLFAVVLVCVLNEGLAWWGGSRSSSSRGGSSRSSSGSSSSRRSSGWWGRRRNQPSNPAPKPQPKPKPPVPAPAPKPNSEDSGKHNSGWWFGRRRNQPSKPAPKPNTVPERKPASKPETDMKKVIEGYEGMNLKAYDAQPKNPKVHDTTIGIGFNLNRPDAKETFEKIVPGVDFNKVKSGKQTITEDQARALFDHDIDNIYEPRARNKVGKDVYDKLPSNVKTALVNAVYRGDLGPKTTNLIKQGKWDKVGKEYLDHEQYRNADKLGIPGVKTRMDWNKKQFDTMIKPKSK
ncbi:uncharacterized protein LOC123540755 isoform X2 [Mercenaria mercenaria]|uniref:uncharacterized protein LOC123540755 isoform X2 n=1 Tax=Mercenaria mercenaria TaxID=6596 RepID=UPI00234EB472|nr:uncharacterized protein LOC123540755 isoform X2 [Mercenaria mercenaria]